MLCAYTGTDSRSYPDYKDAATDRMLQASPGGIYEVTVAPGRAPGLTVPPGDGRWARAAEEPPVPRLQPPAPPADPPAASDAAPDSSIHSEE